MIINKLLHSPKNVKRVSAQDTLESALADVDSSHDTVLVYRDDKFVGAICAHEALFRRRLPYSTKVGNCMITPPLVSPQTPLYTATEYMNATKMYQLPVLSNDNQVDTIISSNAILKYLLNDKSLQKKVEPLIKTRSVITAPINSSVRESYTHMREKEIGRVVLVDDNGKLVGLVSQKDLIWAFIDPIDRQRFRGRSILPTDKGGGGKVKPGSVTKNLMVFDKGQIPLRLNMPIRNFATKKVITANDPSDPIKILEQMHESKVNSLVITDKNNRPTHFISRQDFLKAITLLKPTPRVPISIQDPNDDLSQINRIMTQERLLDFADKQFHDQKIRQLSLKVKTNKSPAGNVLEFYITINTTLEHGNTYFSEAKSMEFRESLHEAIELLTDQIIKQRDQQITKARQQKQPPTDTN